MPTAQLTGPAAPPPAAASPRAARAPQTGRGAVWLLYALLFLAAEAAFSHGSREFAGESRVQVALAALAAVCAAAWLYGPGPRARAPRAATWGIGLMFAFAAWSGLTLAWSVTPDRTWIECNRALAYATVVLLAVAAGAGAPRARARAAVGYLVVAVALALYALGTKVFPGFNFWPLVFRPVSSVPRLRAPLDYWNALALVLLLAVPAAVRVVVDTGNRIRARLAGLAALHLLIVAIGLTYSRGGVLATLVGLAVLIGLAGADRLRTLLYFGLALLAAAPPLAFAFSRPGLADTGIPLDRREGAGLALGLILLGTLAALLFAARGVFGLERRTAPDPHRSLRVAQVLCAAAAVAVLAFVVSLAASPRGLTGSISHGWHSFTTPRGENVTDPARLLSTSAGNRWVWWKEATGAWSDRPLAGWGAGSFPATHLLYRRDRLEVQQPHSMPLQFLAEDGIVGAFLVLSGVGLLMAAAVAGARRLPPGTERGWAAVLAAAAAAYLFHWCVDWDWDIPGATLPALVLLGVAAGAAGGGRAAVDSRPGGAARALVLAGAALAACVYCVSAILPSLGHARADEALVQAGTGTSSAALQSALAKAELASRLDPLSDEGLLAAATVAERRRLFDRAEQYLLDAVRREPSDSDAWVALARVEFLRGNPIGLQQATTRALALDPLGEAPRLVAQQGEALRAPPEASATRTGTPLPGPLP